MELHFIFHNNNKTNNQPYSYTFELAAKVQKIKLYEWINM